jgi:hypothetical protein
MKIKLMIACLAQDSYAVALVRRMAEISAERAELPCRWRSEAACSIGRIETDAPNLFPVFVIGDGPTDLASLGNREGCGRENRILIVSCDHDAVASYGLPDPKTASATYLTVGAPILGFQRIILPTSIAEYRTVSFTNLSALSVIAKLDEAGGNKKPEAAFSELFAVIYPRPSSGEDVSVQAAAAT